MQNKCAVLVLRLAIGAGAAALVLSASSPSFAQQDHARTQDTVLLGATAWF
jgi:hypothetical protein